MNATPRPATRRGVRPTRSEQDLLRYATTMSDVLARVFECCRPLRGLAQDGESLTDAPPTPAELTDFRTRLNRLQGLAIMARFVEFPPSTSEILDNLVVWTRSYDGSGAPVRGRRYRARDVRVGHLRRSLELLADAEAEEVAP